MVAFFLLPSRVVFSRVQEGRTRENTQQGEPFRREKAFIYRFFEMGGFFSFSLMRLRSIFEARIYRDHLKKN